LLIVGLHVSGGFTVVDTGLNVMTDMTVYGNVLLANSPIVFSDRRLKTDIQPLLEPLTKLSQLRGVSYIWNNSIDSRFSFISNDDKRHIGMIAQEVKDIYPELVEEISENGKIFVTKEDNDDVYLGVRYPEMIPILVEAVKEMNDKVSQVEDQVKQSHHPKNKISRIVNEVEIDSFNSSMDCQDLLNLVTELEVRIKTLEQVNSLLKQKLSIYHERDE
jgi:hypothetical protein